MKPTYTQTPDAFKNWRQNHTVRPGALDHEKHGSRQPDGSVQPFTGRTVSATSTIQPGQRTTGGGA